MKKAVRIKIQEAAMRERCGMAPRQPPRDRRGEESDRRLAALPDQVKRRIAATVFFHREGWSAQQLASHFGWSVEDTIRWIESGKPLL